MTKHPRAIVWVCLLAAFPATAEDQPVPPGAAQIVVVDVAVTDKKDRVVTDLQATDFEIEEDGVPVRVENFSAPGPSEPLSVAPTPEATPRPATPPVPTSTLVVYVDMANLGAAGRNRILDGLQQSLEAQLEAGGTRLLVVADLQGLKALTGLTSAPGAVEAAIDALRKAAPHGRDVAADEQSTMGAVRQVVLMSETVKFLNGCPDVVEDVLALIRQHAEWTRRRAGGTIARLTTLVQALGTLPGPKRLLYVSDGLDQRPGTHLFYQFGEICPEALAQNMSRIYAPMDEYDTSPLLQDLAARANAARVTIDTFDASGMRSDSLASPEFAERRFTPSTRTDTLHSESLRDSQRLLSWETGGLSAFDRNEPGAFLKRLADDRGGRYELGYAPGHAPEGRIHQIRVRLKGRRAGGLQLRYRLTYRHQANSDRATERTIAALLFGFVDNPLSVSLQAGEATADGHGGYEVPIRITVPAGPPQGTTLRLVVARRAASGMASIDGPVDIRQKTIQTSPTSNPEVVVTMKMLGGGDDVAVGVYDEATAVGSYMRLRVTPAGAPAAGPPSH